MKERKWIVGKVTKQTQNGDVYANTNRKQSKEKKIMKKTQIEKDKRSEKTTTRNILAKRKQGTCREDSNEK